MAEDYDYRWLLGKTITDVTVMAVDGHSDVPCAVLQFSDGTTAEFWAGYGGYDGKAEDEYPCYIGIGPGPMTRKDMKVVYVATGLPARATDSPKDSTTGD